VPIAPHNCTGPLTLVAAANLTAALLNGLIQEMCRVSFYAWYRRLVDGLPEVDAGTLHLREAPGFGLELLAGLEESSEVTCRRSDAGRS